MGTEQDQGQNQGLPVDFDVLLEGTQNCDEMLDRLRKQIAELKSRGVERIGFVTGLVADLPKDLDEEARRQLIRENSRRLNQHTVDLRAQEPDAFVFSSIDMFHNDRWKIMRDHNANCSPEDATRRTQEFFDRVLGSGVTDLYLTPGWDRSAGSRREHEFAVGNGIRIHEVKPPVGKIGGDAAN
jgi:hypothetical protein